MPAQKQPLLSRQPLPQRPQPLDDIVAELARDVLPYDSGNTHPRFWAYCFGGGHLGAAFADFVASAMNANSASGSQASVFIEQQVLDWVKEILGYPRGAAGVMVSGGTAANMVGVQVARDWASAGAARRQGLQTLPARPLLYASDQVHVSVVKGVETLGLGSESLRRVPSDAGFRLDVEALRDMLREDRAAGCRPFAIIAQAASAPSGAIDPLLELAALAREEKLWLHVDAATAGVAHASPRLRPALRGLGDADSIGLDLHKWMNMPYDVGCVLVRDPQHMQRSFLAASGNPEEAPTWSPSYGLQGSRAFRSLKVWLSLKQHGLDRYVRMFERCHAQASYLAQLVEQSERLELMAPLTLNVVCFRYRRPGAADEELDALNRELLLRVQRSGEAFPSGTELRGHFSLRASLNNHRTRRRDVEALVALVERLGAEL